MHIIIPMSGVGQRFIDAGYKVPKPLIIVDGKPIIEHVCNLFSNEDKFTFICNDRHLADTNIRKILKSIKPNSNIVEIESHKKGPVYAVSLAKHLIEDEEEVIVNYCDFGAYWDYEDFLKHTRARNADGAIPSYKGFHPHMLGNNNYAFIQDKNQWMIQIKEKEPFTNNRMEEYASNGTYYFKKGSYIKKYFQDLIDKKINIQGEYYVSLVYNLLVADGLKVSIYNIQHMLQWGTPQDLEDYNYWSNYFKNSISQRKKLLPMNKSITLIPLAGKGSRFSKLGYKDPKPLIEVSGKPMVVQAAKSLPNSKDYIFVTLKEHLEKYSLKKVLTDNFKNAKIVAIENITKGQAITCSAGLLGVDTNSSLLVAASDNGIIIDENKYSKLIEDENVDAIIFTFRHHTSSKNNPQMYGWVKTDLKDNAIEVSVKIPISTNPYEDHAIVGTFWFKKAEYYNMGLQNLLKKKITINNEYYVDSLMGELIKIGLRVKVFEVNNYICWRTPDDYKTFNYWQSFFHKVQWHPYSLHNDITINKKKLDILDKKYKKFEQESN